MKIGLVVGEAYGDNEIFRPESPLNRDNCLVHLHRLRERLLARGLELVTQDRTCPDGTAAYLFLDRRDAFLKRLEACRYQGKKYLVLFESAVVIEKNWDEEHHREYDAVFTWSPELAARPAERPRYIRYHWPNDLSRRRRPLPFEERSGFAVVMAGNKWSDHPLELYSERLRTIDWFCRHHPDRLDLYGPGWAPSGWKKVKEAARDLRRRARGRPRRLLRWGGYPVYRGMAPSKAEVLEKYRFCLCYENGRDIPGYITEKIFDCFLAGVVPVYWGWEGASALIPPETFIDRRRFASHEALYDFLDSMDASAYGRYLEAIGAFLESEAASLFDVPHFVDTLLAVLDPGTISEAGEG